MLYDWLAGCLAAWETVDVDFVVVVLFFRNRKMQIVYKKI